MMRRISTAVMSALIVVVLATSGCAGANSTGAISAASTNPGVTSPVATPSPSASVSDISAAVQTFVKGLDDLGIKHTDPVRRDVGLSGAKASFDITVDGFDAGINVFSDAETLATWGKASDSFGGIYVASGNAVLTLNSSEGIADSAKIAPLIAAKLGGEAHGV